MVKFSRRSRTVKQPICRRSPNWLTAPGIATATTVVLMAGTMAKPALADPPTIPTLPDVFCFRITDIAAVAGDAEGDAFEIEFEVLNWTNLPADDVDIGLTIASDVEFAGAGIDPNGRPIGPGDDGGPPGNLNTINDWSVDISTPTAIQWEAGTAIPNRDLIGALASGGTAGACALVPGCSVVAGVPVISDPETIDDGDNVLDGFTVEVDDWDIGEVLSFNWFLTNGGSPIGTVLQDNEFGFGVTNVARVDPVGFAGNQPGPVFPTLGNTGFQQGAVEFAPDAQNVRNAGGEIVAAFGAEFGGGITAPFLNPDDSVDICPPDGCPETKVPEPNSLAALGLIALGLLGYGWQRRQQSQRKH